MKFGEPFAYPADILTKYERGEEVTAGLNV